MRDIRSYRVTTICYLGAALRPTVTPVGRCGWVKMLVSTRAVSFESCSSQNLIIVASLSQMNARLATSARLANELWLVNETRSSVTLTVSGVRDTSHIT